MDKRNQTIAFSIATYKQQKRYAKFYRCGVVQVCRLKINSVKYAFGKGENIEGDSIVAKFCKKKTLKFPVDLILKKCIATLRNFHDTANITMWVAKMVPQTEILAQEKVKYFIVLKKEYYTHKNPSPAI